MSLGQASLVDDTPLIADLLLGGGHGSSTLVFQEPNEEVIAVMNEGTRLPAATCKSCGHYLIIVPDPEYTDSQCMACKAVMPAGVTACLKCGWTYNEE